MGGGAEYMPENEFKKIRPPKRYTTTFKSVLPVRPATPLNSKVINKQTYDTLMNCIDIADGTVSCTTEEWRMEDSPFKISEQSLPEMENFQTFTRLRIGIKNEGS